MHAWARRTVFRLAFQHTDRNLFKGSLDIRLKLIYSGRLNWVDAVLNISAQEKARTSYIGVRGARMLETAVNESLSGEKN